MPARGKATAALALHRFGLGPAGNGIAAIAADPRGALVQPNLIFPTPCEFISRALPHCAIVRPTLDRNGGAVATIKSFTADRLFEGQSARFFTTVMELARKADAAGRRTG